MQYLFVCVLYERVQYLLFICKYACLYVSVFLSNSLFEIRTHQLVPSIQTKRQSYSRLHQVTCKKYPHTLLYKFHPCRKKIQIESWIYEGILLIESWMYKEIFIIEHRGRNKLFCYNFSIKGESWRIWTIFVGYASNCGILIGI